MTEKKSAESGRGYYDQAIEFIQLIAVTMFWRLVLLITVIFKSR